jgi:hypothetical protein
MILSSIGSRNVRKSKSEGGSHSVGTAPSPYSEEPGPQRGRSPGGRHLCGQHQRAQPRCPGGGTQSRGCRPSEACERGQQEQQQQPAQPGPRLGPRHLPLRPPLARPSNQVLQNLIFGLNFQKHVSRGLCAFSPIKNSWYFFYIVPARC